MDPVWLEANHAFLEVTVTGRAFAEEEKRNDRVCHGTVMGFFGDAGVNASVCDGEMAIDDGICLATGNDFYDVLRFYAYHVVLS
jgi:hypothetical protein